MPDFRPNLHEKSKLHAGFRSYGLWKSRFASDPRVAGKTFSLDGKPVQIIGVLPAEFEMPNLGLADMLLPLTTRSSNRGPMEIHRCCPVKDFHELKVWQKAHQLTLAVYRVTAGFPREELYGLTSQLRRACSSIGANLAEGCGRHGDAEFARFCSLAMGSASEMEYHLLLARDLKLINSKDYEAMNQRATELKRMLTALMRKLNADG